jgi:hypothetical protein
MENQDMQQIIAMLAKIDATQKEIKTNQARMNATLDAWLTDMKDNREKTEAYLTMEWKKPASVEMKPEVADKEVPLEDAVVMPVGEPRNRLRDRRHLAAQRRQK